MTMVLAECLRRDLDLSGEDMEAAWWAHCAGHPTPPEVTTATNAHGDLMARLKAEGWRDPTRDERRLLSRYKTILDGHHASVLDAYRHRS